MESIHGARFLVVDDEPDMREITAYEFKSLGAEIYLAHGAHSALKILEERPIDMIISDYLMPEGSGLHLLKGLREKKIHVPTIILTGFSELTREEVLEFGAKEMFFKPVNWARLIQFVGELLQKPSSLRLELT